MAISVGHAPAPLHEFAGGEPLDDGEEVLVVLVLRAVPGLVALERFGAAADAEGFLFSAAVSIRDDVVQHNILAAYYVMYRIFAVAQAGGVVPGGHS